MHEGAGPPSRTPPDGGRAPRGLARRAHVEKALERGTGGPAASDYGLPERVTCPFCGNDDTELHSPFGPQLSMASYWCRRCHTAFDWIKR